MADDRDKQNPEEEEEVDQVSAAYENISKKLESLRKEKKDEDEEDGNKEDLDDKEDPLDPMPGTEDEEELSKKEALKLAEKSEDEDPLDKEDPDEIEKESDEDEKPKETFREEKKEDEVDEVETEDLPQKTLSDDNPDSLDDLASEARSEIGRPTSFKPEKSEDQYDIPNLRPSYKPEPEIPRETRPPFPSETSYTRGESSSPDNFFNKHQTKPPSRRGNKLSLLILLIIGLGVIGFTFYLLKNGFSSQATPSPSPTPIVQEPSPTPSPSPDLDRSKYKLRILNGTTTSGLAKTVSDKLKETGYQIERTGNAPKQTYKVSEVRVKSGTTGLSEQIIKDLPSEYSNASSSGELKETDTADAEIILGSD